MRCDCDTPKSWNMKQYSCKIYILNKNKMFNEILK